MTIVAPPGEGRPTVSANRLSFLGLKTIGGDQVFLNVSKIVDIVAWARTAELCAEYLKKGRQVFIEGRLTQDRWEGQDGRKMSKVRVTAENIQFLGARPSGSGGGGGESAAPAAEAAGDEAPPGEDIPF